MTTRQPATDFPNVVAERHIFWECTPPGAMTPKFEFGRDFCTMRLPLKFHHPMFTHLKVIVTISKHTHKQTNTQSHKQTDAAENIRSSLRYYVS